MKTILFHQPEGKVLVLFLWFFALFFVTCRNAKTPAASFFEELPVDRMYDLALVELQSEPDRVQRGETFIVKAVIRNNRRAISSPATVVFGLKEEEIYQAEVPPLSLGETFETEIEWRLELPGRHGFTARLIQREALGDIDPVNDEKTTFVRVAGEPARPELAVNAVLDKKGSAEEPKATVTFHFRNPGFVGIADVPIDFKVNGETIFRDRLDILPPGESTQMTFQLDSLEGGQSTIGLSLQVTDDFYDAGSLQNLTWLLTHPDENIVHQTPDYTYWLSLGPMLISNGSPNNSVGRIDAIVFDPADPDKMYAGAPSGGIWKSNNRGGLWLPVGDILPRMDISAMAADPGNAGNLYAVTGFFAGPWNDPDAPFYKSINGGKTWHVFQAGMVQGSRRIEVRNPKAGEVIIYVGTNRGLYRYHSTDPDKLSSTQQEWTLIKGGIIQDLRVHPSNHKIVYASVVKEGLYRTDKGDVATDKAADWIKVTLHKDDPNTNIAIDFQRGDPNIVFAASTDGETVKIYRSENGIDQWAFIISRTKHPNLLQDYMYNPYLRVHPTKEVVYYGGNRVYKAYKTNNKWVDVEITGIHIDQKALEFSLFEPDIYYCSNDGGIWRCKVNATGNDACVHCNSNLRVTQFFDIDVSRTTPDLVIGGTQDVGTLLWKGKPVWREVLGGDGNYSLIASTDNQVMYAQYQFLRDTKRSDDGGKTWKNANTGLPQDGKWRSSIGGGNAAFITYHPKYTDGKVLFSQGDQVYRTINGGNTWTPMGLNNSNAKGTIARVAVQPQNFTIFAGTSYGEILYYSKDVVQQWKLLFSHPQNGAVASMSFAPSDPNVLYVLHDLSYPANRIRRLEYGEKGWKNSFIAGNFPTQHLTSSTYPYPVYLRSVVGDPSNARIAFVATNKGVFRGESPCDTCPWDWKPFGTGLPLVDVRDLTVYHDSQGSWLYAATWGRGLWRAKLP